jgi:hypothetical protein
MQKGGVQLTPMLRGSLGPHIPPLLTLEDSMAAQILEAMSPRTSTAMRNNLDFDDVTTHSGRAASLTSPRPLGEQPHHNYADPGRSTQRSFIESPKKRAYESSDEEDDDGDQGVAAEDVDLDGGVVLSEETLREIITRPPKPEGDSEWRVEWCAKQRCWSWIHHRTQGQIFSSPLEMDADAREHAATTAPVAVFESMQHTLLPERPPERPASQIWTSEEEQQLKYLVAQLGAGDWSTKASLFCTNRSASALRHRWYSVHAEQPGGGGPATLVGNGGSDYVSHTAPERMVGVSSWTKEEDDALRAVRLPYLSLPFLTFPYLPFYTLRSASSASSARSLSVSVSSASCCSRIPLGCLRHTLQRRSCMSVAEANRYLSACLLFLLLLLLAGFAGC